MRKAQRLAIGALGVVFAISTATSLPILGKAKGNAAWDSSMSSGRSALKSGDYSEAKRSLNLALESTKMFQTNDPRLGDTYQALGQLYLGDQEYGQAKEYFNRALMVQQSTPGIDELTLADTLYGLATASEMLGDRDMAVILLKRVRDIWGNKYGARSDKLIGVLKPLGIYSSVNGDFKVAEACYRQLVSIEESQGSSAELGSSLNQLAATLTKEGKLNEASTVAERAVSMLKATDETRIAADGASDNLAYINQQLGKTEKVVEQPKPVEQPKVVEQPKPVEQPKVVEQPKPVEQPKVAVQPKPVEQPKIVVQVKPVEQPKVAVQPKPVEQPKIAEQPKPVEQPKIAEAPKVTKVVLAPPSSTAITHVGEFRPWESKDAATQTTPNQNSNWGKIRYLAGGKLISQEEYQAMLLANEAYELIRTEKYKMACDILKKALGVCPTLASAHTNLGLALTQLGENDAAISHLRQAIAIDPNRSAAWINLATAFQLSGELKSALVTYSEYSNRFASEPLAKKAQQIAVQLEQEVKEQSAIVEAGGGTGAPDYFAYASHTAGTVRWGEPAAAHLKVYIQPASGVPGYKSEYDGFCAEAFKQWASASKDRVSFEFVKKPETADIDWVWTNDSSKVSSVAEGGETNVSYDGKKIKHATVTVLTKNPAMDSPLSPNQIRAVSLHEIGHALGLIGHSPKPQDIMYCSMPPAMSRPNLSARDVNTIEKLYTQSVSYVRKNASRS